MALASANAAPQSPAPQDPATAFGYVYRLPEDWKIIEPKGPAPAQQQNEEQKTSSIDVKKGIECLEVPLTARHGDPPTTIVIAALPYECYGQKLTSQDLPIVGAGAAEGLKQTFDITDPIEATYLLAGHNMWVERARSTAKGKPAPSYTVEIVCTLLSRAAVCWVAQAADGEDLHTFEQQPVTLDGAPAPALVPANAFITR